MIDKKRIDEEAERFFEWPDPKKRTDVTFTSCKIFANVIAEMVREECVKVCEDRAKSYANPPIDGNEFSAGYKQEEAELCAGAIDSVLTQK